MNRGQDDDKYEMDVVNKRRTVIRRVNTACTVSILVSTAVTHWIERRFESWRIRYLFLGQNNKEGLGGVNA